MAHANGLQGRMNAAFDNYFAVSDILREDLDELRKNQNATQYWKRTFVRSSAALFEGYTHCLSEICAISFECIAPELTKKEADALRSESKLGTNDRVRLTLRAAYRLFELSPAPDFGEKGWIRAQRAFDKRHSLMHPKTSDDLVVDEAYWIEIREGVSWLLTQFVRFFVLLQAKLHAN